MLHPKNPQEGLVQGAHPVGGEHGPLAGGKPGRGHGALLLHLLRADLFQKGHVLPVEEGSPVLELEVQGPLGM